MVKCAKCGNISNEVQYITTLSKYGKVCLKCYFELSKLHKINGFKEEKVNK